MTTMKSSSLIEIIKSSGNTKYEISIGYDNGNINSITFSYAR